MRRVAIGIWVAAVVGPATPTAAQAASGDIRVGGRVEPSCYSFRTPAGVVITRCNGALLKVKAPASPGRPNVVTIQPAV